MENSELSAKRLEQISKIKGIVILDLNFAKDQTVRAELALLKPMFVVTRGLNPAKQKDVEKLFPNSQVSHHP